MDVHYQSGFGNEFASEALPGALPVGQNSPQRCAYGLYAEQLSGTAFTAPRHHNQRTWLYRIRPAAMHEPFERFDGAPGLIAAIDPSATSPNQLRWNPPPLPDADTDFLAGLTALAGTGSPASQHGFGIYTYTANRSMRHRHFYSADGEWLLLPQQGRLHVYTELGLLVVDPQELVVIPRGIRFRVELPDGPVRGYACENFGAALRLPDLGPIGANGLANPRDFLSPVARYEDEEGPHELIGKFMGGLWRADLGHSPLDVVAWHGNHVPYKYDMRRFSAVGSITFDHPDPSIFTVLTSPSDTPGTANLDLVAFAPRILVMENTFRPPWFHRNFASEFMGLIHGVYDAKADGFSPGGASLHNSMSGHGPDAETFEKASAADTGVPHYVRDTLAFMLESRYVIHPTVAAMASPQLQPGYYRCWQGLQRHFDPNRPGV